MTQHRIGTANNHLLHRKKKEVKIKKTGKANQIKMKMSIINLLNSSSFCCITQLPKILTPWRHAQGIRIFLELENVLACLSGILVGSNHEKNRGLKISRHTSLKKKIKIRRNVQY